MIWGRLSGVGAGLAGVVFMLDQGVKWWMLEVFGIAERQPVAVTRFLDLVLAWNQGVSYGLMPMQAQGLLIALSLAVTAALWVWLARTPRPPTAAALGLIIGGALGNALDRAVHGAVADFFLLHWGDWNWYVFNLADVAIVAGVAILLYESFIEGRRA